MMRNLFESATLKLTAWYMLIIFLISLVFSVAIYQISANQVDARLGNIQTQLHDKAIVDLPGDVFDALRHTQTSKAKQAILMSLVYINMSILTAGGVGSYLLAKRTLRPIKEAHESQSQFVSDASHELRTPLATIKIENETYLRDPRVTKKELLELVSSNVEEVDRLTKLTHALLRLSRNETLLSQTELIVQDLISQAVQRQPEAARISTKLPAKPLRVHGDEPSLEELIMILLDNAQHYSPIDSEITVRLTKYAKNVKLQITNSGPGIAQKDIPHVFDRFYRADKSRRSDGYGLGLPLARHITHLHRGSIRSISTPGKTTSFIVTLPLA